jgi:hypothetical protein
VCVKISLKGEDSNFHELVLAAREKPTDKY